MAGKRLLLQSCCPPVHLSKGQGPPADARGPREASSISQGKSGSGSGGEAPSAREAHEALRSETEQRTSLDVLQTNRNSALKSVEESRKLSPLRNVEEFRKLSPIRIVEEFRELKRKRYCGIWTIMGPSQDGTKKQLRRVNCRTWDCSFCGPRKAKRYKRAIRAAAEREKLNRFLALTLDPAKTQGSPVRYLRKVFDKFRVYLRRKYGVSIR